MQILDRIEDQINATGLPLVGISATVLVSGARVTTGCERSEPAAPASAAPDAAVSAAPTAAPDVGKLAPESQP